MQAAEKAERHRCELERQLEATRTKAERLAKELQEATAKAQEARAASLQAQVPSVAQLPCSADSLLEGLLGKSHPHLVGAPEVEGIKKQLEALAAKASAEYHVRMETERQTAEAAKQVHPMDI